MMNSIFFECSNNLSRLDLLRIAKVLKTMNKKIKTYLPGYNAKFLDYYWIWNNTSAHKMISMS